MIFKELLDICSIENVVKEMQEQFVKESIDKEQLFWQVKLLIQKMQAEENYLIHSELFCIMAVPRENEDNSLYVGVYDVDEKDIVCGWEKYRINKVRDWGFTENQVLGITVFEPSIKKYGIDCIVAGVLSFIMFGD